MNSLYLTSLIDLSLVVKHILLGLIVSPQFALLLGLSLLISCQGRGRMASGVCIHRPVMGMLFISGSLLNFQPLLSTIEPLMETVSPRAPHDNGHGSNPLVEAATACAHGRLRADNLTPVIQITKQIS